MIDPLVTTISTISSTNFIVVPDSRGLSRARGTVAVCTALMPGA